MLGLSSPSSGHIRSNDVVLTSALIGDAAEMALATLQNRPIAGVTPHALLVLSPYPPTTPPTALPPPSASPRLVKHLPPDYTDTQLFNLFRPYGALASVRTQAQFGKDTGVVEFWREEDARRAEEALQYADVEGQSIAVQIFQQRRTSGNVSEFNVTAPAFVPSGSGYPGPYPPQVSQIVKILPSCIPRAHDTTVTTTMSSVLSFAGEFLSDESTCAVYSWAWPASAARSYAWTWLN